MRVYKNKSLPLLLQLYTIQLTWNEETKKKCCTRNPYTITSKEAIELFCIFVLLFVEMYAHIRQLTNGNPQARNKKSKTPNK